VEFFYVTGSTFRNRCGIPVSDSVAHRTWLPDAWQWMSTDRSSGRGARRLWQPVTGLCFHMSSLPSAVFCYTWFLCSLVDEQLWFCALL